MSFAKKVINFYQTIEPPTGLPAEVDVLHPYRNQESLKVTKAFYQKFYNDEEPRHLLLGINPGRFGGGITGIPFTDPIRLEESCGISNAFEKKAELSSKFIYEMIDAYGGPASFYQQFYFSAISPLGYTKAGKNLNYYDIPAYLDLFEDYALSRLQEQIAFPLTTDVAFCIGQGQNLKFLERLNAKYQIFREIKTIPHPRWIMQYRLKQKEDFIQLYINELTAKN